MEAQVNQTRQKVKEQFRLFLTNKGLKATLQRSLILDAFLDLDRSTHIDELYLILRGKHPNIGHATVYRALRLFTTAGIAREINLGDGLTRYELAGGRRHDYLVCSDCGTVTEFENSSIERHQAEVARSMGFTVQSLKIELRGVCNRCMAQPE
ncbi:transcriptional repressor [Geomonas subterranea]|uniref:Ferric uptake regulation protein n=1 Tax=Geomonas subterranea TaxID=2847989 RepID=A0ABX8LN49_9BACT|nr:transcriptional repressor [Geomonas subterranea]QXM11638.1 transcriptional repressor [Geomonas subterranea]